jgi:hypothetical protein
MLIGAVLLLMAYLYFYVKDNVKEATIYLMLVIALALGYNQYKIESKLNILIQANNDIIELQQQILKKVK